MEKVLFSMMHVEAPEIISMRSLTTEEKGQIKDCYVIQSEFGTMCLRFIFESKYVDIPLHKSFEQSRGLRLDQLLIITLKNEHGDYLQISNIRI